MFHRPLLDVPDPFPSFCSTPTPTTPTSLPMTGSGDPPALLRTEDYSLTAIAECAEVARLAWGGGRYKAARGAMREQGRSNTRVASLPHVKLAPMTAPGPTGERHAIVSFAGAAQRRRLF